MSLQTLGLRRSALIVRRYKAIVGIAAGLGLVAGAAYTAVNPPVYTSSALVALSPSVNIATQAVVADSATVLSLALPSLGPGVSLGTLESRVQATRLAVGLMSVSAQGSTPTQAVATANAVSRSYVAYADSARNPVGQQPAEVFRPAATATGTGLTTRLLTATAAGVAAGALIGIVITLAIGRNDRRLRERDEMADSIGVPVLASVRTRHAAKAAGWAKLLEDFERAPADAWQLRTVLRELGVNTARPAAAGGSSVAVLSLSGDRRALALGPQLAVFAAALGIPAALVVGPQQDVNTTAPLRAACAAAAGRPGNLQVIVADHDDASELPGGVLSVVVGVVDGETPRAATTMRAVTTLLGVTSGAATAQQLARIAASAAGDGRFITGILVADPDPADKTTGRLPHLARLGQYRMPTRMSSAVTEVRQ